MKWRAPTIAFLAGAASLAIELVWIRMLSLELGSASVAARAIEKDPQSEALRRLRARVLEKRK